MKKTISEIMVILLLASMLTLAFNIQQAESSEPPETEWNRTYGGACDDISSSVVQTDDGGYAIAGSTSCTSDGRWDILLIKTDANGNMQWNKTYGDVGSDEHALSLINTADGGYALAGALDDPHYADVDDFLLVKTDANGNMQWNKTYGGSKWEFVYSLVQTSDGGYALAGPTRSFGGGGLNFWLVKTDANGNMLWNSVYGGPVDDYAESIIQTSDGGYAILGSTHVGYANWDMWLFKTDESGTEQWNKTYGGSREEFGEAVVQTSDGGYALGGFTYSFGAGLADFWLVKTDANGVVQWDRSYGDGDYDDAFSMIQTSDGGYILVGQSGGQQQDSKDAWVVKTDGDGNMEWDKTYGGSLYDWFNCVTQTTDGGYAIGGRTRSFGAGGYDFWLIKLAPEEIPATVDIDPDTLNLKSNGQWITVYITLPEGYNVADIVLETVCLDGVPAEWSEIQNGVYMVKFDRATVQTSLTNEPDYDSAPKFYDLTLTVTGELVAGTPFEGEDTITVIKK